MKTETPSIVERKLLSSRLAGANRNNFWTARTRSSHETKEAQAKFKRKVGSGEYEFEDVACFCGSRQDVLISEIDRHGFYYPLVICKRCGLVRANPRMTESSFAHFYRYEYRSVYGESSNNIEELFNYRVNQGKQRCEQLTGFSKLAKGAVIFEIGCDFGTTLAAFYQKGHEVYGCDYGVEHIEYGRKKTGLNNIFSGGVAKLKQTGKKADLIIMHHVLEHFLDLEKELKVITEIIKSTALVFISVPGTFWWIENICSKNIMGLLQNAHTYQFSLESLNYVMECCGFKLVSGDQRIEAFFKKGDKFKAKDMIPVQEFKRVSNYLRRVERRYLPIAYSGKLLEIVGLKEIAKTVVQKLQ